MTNKTDESSHSRDQETRLAPRILTVAALLSDLSLEVPLYQRPYKWTTKNVCQLFEDIAAFADSKSYRLGTIVFHDDEETGKRNIVDGQQRTMTLLLAVHALISERLATLDRKDLSEQLAAFAVPGRMINPKFKSEESKSNLRTNYLEIVRIVSRVGFTEEMIDFLLNRCEVVTFTLGDLSEAFQFFDSQNARGRDLELHDLLKAYHLREFETGDEGMKAVAVEDWESCQTTQLAGLFAGYLFRIRSWSRGSSARWFGKGDTPLFKGIRLDGRECHPFAESLRIAHHFVDHYNGQYERRIVGGRVAFPFQLDQTIINGRRFFEMIAHYRAVVSRMTKKFEGGDGRLSAGLEKQAEEIVQTINSYRGKHRDGDRYVRGIFDCLLIFFVDKFGEAELSRAIEKIFLWAYTIRLQRSTVQLASVDNYVQETGMFQRVREAMTPWEFLRVPLPTVSGNASSGTEAVCELFKKMGYFHE